MSKVKTCAHACKSGFLISMILFVFPIVFHSLIASVNAQPCVTPPPGLVSWWPGDGNADDIWNGNLGTLMNGATFAPGKVDQAFSFDGVDDFVWATGTGIDNLQQLTIEAWVKLDSLPYRIQRFVTLAPPGLERAVLRYNSWGGGPRQLHFYMRIGDEFTDFTHINVDDVLTAGVWHHVAGTYDGDFMRLYLDGVEIDNLEISGPVATDTDHGVRFSSPDEPLDGLLDEVSIYNRALTATEIQTIFNAGSAGKCKRVREQGDTTRLNAQFIHWPRMERVIHVLGWITFPVPPYEGGTVATLDSESPVIFGYEAGYDLTALWEYKNDPDNNMRLKIDGAVVADNLWLYWQDPFVAQPGVGPKWTWDHDGDGLGDGNGNGVGDWDFPVMFWRFEIRPGLSLGDHIWELEETDDNWVTWFLLSDGILRIVE